MRVLDGRGAAMAFSCRRLRCCDRILRASHVRRVPATAAPLALPGCDGRTCRDGLANAGVAGRVMPIAVSMVVVVAFAVELESALRLSTDVGINFGCLIVRPRRPKRSGRKRPS